MLAENLIVCRMTQRRAESDRDLLDVKRKKSEFFLNCCTLAAMSSFVGCLCMQIASMMREMNRNKFNHEMMSRHERYISRDAPMIHVLLCNVTLPHLSFSATFRFLISVFFFHMKNSPTCELLIAKLLGGLLTVRERAR